MKHAIRKDLRAVMRHDPAARSKLEVALTYSGFHALVLYRFAHFMHVHRWRLFARMVSQFAKFLTGVEIHPGARIGCGVVIDHGEGVVIGETTKIGDHVKLYQGVTLGALSTRGGQRLSGVKRHPTIEDNVTVYSNASVLGGETVIGEGSVVAGSTFVTFSVPPHSRVAVKEQEITVRGPGERD